MSIIIFKNIPVDETPPHTTPLNLKRGLRHVLYIELGANESRILKNIPPIKYKRLLKKYF